MAAITNSGNAGNVGKAQAHHVHHGHHLHNKDHAKLGILARGTDAVVAQMGARTPQYTASGSAGSVTAAHRLQASATFTA